MAHLPLQSTRGCLFSPPTSDRPARSWCCRPSRWGFTIALLGALAACQDHAVVEGALDPTVASKDFQATAYSDKGRTASGARSHPGIVAADPAVLPIGSRIRI